ncbi:RES family NAD+ phosphorylase [Kitasatospora sp. NPDC058032]|uniref:RES family NAD+ phosphorylase n=1 Tax=Kitasatospora sp. NPDC058032 TaxID=3346307 RepID=UPI0036DED87C
MPDVKVPAPTVRATPHRDVLPAGTVLHRVHLAAYPATTFNPNPSDTHYEGGRFCSYQGDGAHLPYLYAGFSERTAVMETLVRGVPFDERGWRRIRRAAVRGRVLSRIETTCDIPLVGLMTLDQLAAVHQDEWLIHSTPDAYPRTRRWAAWIRGQAPWAHGLRWPSKRDLGSSACILYERGDAPAMVKPTGAAPVALDTAEGAELLNRLLAPARTRIDPPRR